MPYHFNIDRIHEQMFLLQMLISGSENYCSEHGVHPERDSDEGHSWNYYLGHLKSIVSSSLIESSIQCRMLSDTLQKDSEELEVDLKSFDKQATEGLVLGSVLEGAVKLSLRESFNKLIHATEMTLGYDTQCNDQMDYQYWTGEVDIEGHYQGEKWVIAMEIFSWSQAVQRFLALVEDNVDFYRMYKYDY